MSKALALILLIIIEISAVIILLTDLLKAYREKRKKVKEQK